MIHFILVRDDLPLPAPVVVREKGLMEFRLGSYILWVPAEHHSLLQTGADAYVMTIGHFFTYSEASSDVGATANPREHAERAGKLLFGRFVIIAIEGASATVFPGPGATLHYVYSEALPAVASSEELLYCVAPELREGVGGRPEVSRISASTGLYYAFGLTDNPWIRVGLANHALELPQMVERRFWPRANEIEVFEGEIHRRKGRLFWDQLNSLLLRNACFCSKVADDVIIPITSGRDSRLILSLFDSYPRERISTFSNPSPVHDRRVGALLGEAGRFRWQQGEPVTQGVCLPGFGGEIFKGYWSRTFDFEAPSRALKLLSANPLFRHLETEQARGVAVAYATEITELTSSDTIACELFLSGTPLGRHGGKGTPML